MHKVTVSENCILPPGFEVFIHKSELKLKKKNTIEGLECLVDLSCHRAYNQVVNLNFRSHFEKNYYILTIKH